MATKSRDVHALVGARISGLEFDPIWPGDNEGVRLVLSFEDGRMLDVWAMGGIEGSASLEVTVEHGPA